MKTRITHNLTLLFVAFFFLYSCSVDDFKVQGQLTEQTFVKNEASARSVLNGIYDGNRPNGDLGIFYSVLGAMTAGVEQQALAGSSYESFQNNNVKPVGVQDYGGFYSFYKKAYRTINLANVFIKTVEEKGIEKTSKETQKTLLAEARTLRAHTYFRLLRIFGQFFDLSSEYGVITTTKVIDGLTYLKRAKVSETYDQIISDLEYAVQYGSDSRERYYVTKTFAKALLAKVYLYRGGADSWLKTERYCKEIIDDLGAKFDLVEQYGLIFKEGYKSKEVIYAPIYNKNESILGSNPMGSSTVKPSAYFTQLAQTKTGIDPRFVFNYKNSTDEQGTYYKYTFTNATFYYLRVAEVYLMYAEAVARTGGDMQVALEALNTVRKRAFNSEDSGNNSGDDGNDDGNDGNDDGDDDSNGFRPSKNSKVFSAAPSNTYTFVDKATLLEDIRKEKMLELNLENGESWFDLVRYHTLGDLDATKLKPSIKSVNQLIFPIPLKAIANNPNFGNQNPGYK